MSNPNFLPFQSTLLLGQNAAYGYQSASSGAIYNPLNPNPILLPSAAESSPIIDPNNGMLHGRHYYMVGSHNASLPSSPEEMSAQSLGSMQNGKIPPSGNGIPQSSNPTTGSHTHCVTHYTNNSSMNLSLNPSNAVAANMAYTAATGSGSLPNSTNCMNGDGLNRPSNDVYPPNSGAKDSNNIGNNNLINPRISKDDVRKILELGERENLKKMNVLEKKLAQVSKERNQYKHMAHTLKGNIRVMCRIRPDGIRKDDTLKDLKDNNPQKQKILEGSNRDIFLDSGRNNITRESHLKCLSDTQLEVVLPNHGRSMNGGGSRNNSDETGFEESRFQHASTKAINKIAGSSQKQLNINMSDSASNNGARRKSLSANTKFRSNHQIIPSTKSASALQDIGGGGNNISHLNYTKSLDEPKVFFFDRLFDAHTTEDEVFDCVGEEIRAAMEGHSVSLIAYGATGSGKTHSISNIAMRMGSQLQEYVDYVHQVGDDVEVKVQLLEIYNEQLRDLLTKESREIKIVQEKTATIATPVVQVLLPNDNCTSGLHEVLEIGRKNRSTHLTNIHEWSSRSHLIISTSIRRTQNGNMIQSGKLNLIDLAGSERVKKSEATGDRLREAQAINRSLSALADVIWAFERKVAYIPFRNSKLTHLLQDSLGGPTTRTVMFFTISGHISNIQETLCTLQFGSRLNSLAFHSGLNARKCLEQNRLQACLDREQGRVLSLTTAEDQLKKQLAAEREEKKQQQEEIEKLRQENRRLKQDLEAKGRQNGMPPKSLNMGDARISRNDSNGVPKNISSGSSGNLSRPSPANANPNVGNANTTVNNANPQPNNSQISTTGSGTNTSSGTTYSPRNVHSSMSPRPKRGPGGGMVAPSASPQYRGAAASGGPTKRAASLQFSPRTGGVGGVGGGIPRGSARSPSTKGSHVGNSAYGGASNVSKGSSHNAAAVGRNPIGTNGITLAGNQLTQASSATRRPMVNFPPRAGSRVSAPGGPTVGTTSGSGGGGTGPPESLSSTTRKSPPRASPSRVGAKATSHQPTVQHSVVGTANGTPGVGTPMNLLTSALQKKYTPVLGAGGQPQVRGQVPVQTSRTASNASSAHMNASQGHSSNGGLGSAIGGSGAGIAIATNNSSGTIGGIQQPTFTTTLSNNSSLGLNTQGTRLVTGPIKAPTIGVSHHTSKESHQPDQTNQSDKRLPHQILNQQQSGSGIPIAVSCGTSGGTVPAVPSTVPNPAVVGQQIPPQNAIPNNASGSYFIQKIGPPEAREFCRLFEHLQGMSTEDAECIILSRDNPNDPQNNLQKSNSQVSVSSTGSDIRARLKKQLTEGGRDFRNNNSGTTNSSVVAYGGGQGGHRVVGGQGQYATNSKSPTAKSPPKKYRTRRK